MAERHRLLALYEDCQHQLTGLQQRVLSLLDAAGPNAGPDGLLLRLSLANLRALIKDVGWYGCGLSRSRHHCPPPRQ
jgi:hypothetical protein